MRPTRLGEQKVYLRVSLYDTAAAAQKPVFLPRHLLPSRRMTVSLKLTVPHSFDLSGVATSHGWYQLAPWTFDRAGVTLSRPFRVGPALARARISQRESVLEVSVEGEHQPRQLDDLASQVSWCLRPDEDLSEFSALCAADPALCASVAPSGGRLLRSPTLWEDVVKTILTTNTTWSQTKAMAARLVATLGPQVPGDPSLQAFPSPEAVAAAGEDVFREQVRLGYRNASVLRIAQDIVDGGLDLEALKDSDLPTIEVRKRLLALPGVGPYAAATLLMILGRYDELAIDTELRAHVSRKYYRGEPVTEQQMRSLYEHWGRWRYLAYWFDPR